MWMRYSTCLLSLLVVLILARYHWLFAGVPPSVTVSEAAPDSTPGCVHEQEDTCLHILCLHALITPRWEPLLHGLFNLIPLSSQTVLTWLVSPHNLSCINVLSQTGTHTVHSWSFLAFYHRFSTNGKLQLHSAAQLSPLGQVYAGYRAAVHTIPYSSKVRSWEREMNKYIALWTHAVKTLIPSFSMLFFPPTLKAHALTFKVHEKRSCGSILTVMKVPE